jgi:hypothetical protein
MSRLFDRIFPPCNSETENSPAQNEKPRRMFTLVSQKKAKRAHIEAGTLAEERFQDHPVTGGTHANRENRSTEEVVDSDCISCSTTPPITSHNIQPPKIAVKESTLAEQISVRVYVPFIVQAVFLITPRKLYRML